ncbi:hypothetical protein IRJ34_02810 [Paenarthrobacter sp. GOM3]|uniref:hypothetical protein n=1 Tax=Paenarthrobacter sp. GOM3 TaxID=2782567 RepID=UPI001BA6910B|nr:hypothetical protein [Paenarthrobacter sp. GOM3]WOH19276.1 hypothetical protein IRJ34_02810 [Paenarthrobacter sp. GOM3]
MRDEPKGRLKARSILAAVFLAAIALSACTATTTEKPMTGPNAQHPTGKTE